MKIMEMLEKISRNFCAIIAWIVLALVLIGTSRIIRVIFFRMVTIIVFITVSVLISKYLKEK